MKQTIATRIQDALRQAGYALSNHALATRLGLRESSVRRTTRQLVEARKIARGPFSYMANRETYVSKGDGVKACSGFQLSKRKPIRVPAEGNSMRTHMEETRDDWPGRALIITALALLDEEVLGLDDICGVHRNLNTAREKLAAWLGFVYHPATNRYHKER